MSRRLPKCRGALGEPARVKALLTELAKYPRYDRGYDYGKMEQENQKRLHQAIKTVLGVNMDTFSRRWLKWISSQKG